MTGRCSLVGWTDHIFREPLPGDYVKRIFDLTGESVRFPLF
jgi:hypothetical protein